jgi:hypothetical protein
MRNRLGAIAGGTGGFVGAPTGSTGAAGAADWINAFAFAVASALHAGQNTGAGIRPFTGSTSNLNFVPQSQRTLISMDSGG